jgi:hypothetical protein
VWGECLVGFTHHPQFPWFRTWLHPLSGSFEDLHRWFRYDVEQSRSIGNAKVGMEQKPDR